MLTPPLRGQRKALCGYAPRRSSASKKASGTSDDACARGRHLIRSSHIPPSRESVTVARPSRIGFTGSCRLREDDRQDPSRWQRQRIAGAEERGMRPSLRHLNRRDAQGFCVLASRSLHRDGARLEQAAPSRRSSRVEYRCGRRYHHRLPARGSIIFAGHGGHVAGRYRPIFLTSGYLTQTGRALAQPCGRSGRRSFPGCCRTQARGAR